MFHSLCPSLSSLPRLRDLALSWIFFSSVLPLSTVFFPVSGRVIEAMMIVNGVISGPTGRCCAIRCIPGELVTLGEEGRAPTGLHYRCVFHPHLLFLLFPMEPEAGKKR